MTSATPDTARPAAPIRHPARRRLARAAALLLLAVPGAAAAQRAQLERAIRRTTLPNGLEVMVVENHGVPLATIEADVRNGSFVQTPDLAGLAHLYEHMFFKANAEYPEPGAFLDRAAELGAVFNGTTTEERVNYYLTLPSDSLVGGMRFLAAALIHPLFRADELARERQVVIGEYDRNESSPYYQLTTEVGKALWGTAWERKNPLGERSVILATTPEQMREIQHRYYIPNNSALVVTGDVNADSVFALARRIYGDWPRGPDPFTTYPIPPIPPLPRDTAVIVEQPVGTVLVIMQWQGPSVRKDPEATYAADVFSDLMNQPGSTLQRRLVDSGLFESIDVNYYTLNHVGPITISGETTPDKLRDAVAALRREIARFDDPGYFTAAALAPVKQQRIVGTIYGLERASGFAHVLGFWWSVAGLDYYMGYADNMARQTPADIRAYVRRYIIGRPSVTGVLISPSARQAIGLTARDLLAGARPSAGGHQ